MNAKEIDLDLINEFLSYDSQTGHFRWKVNVKRIKTGDLAGSYDKDGYIRIQIKGQAYKAHRLAYQLIYGDLEVDDLIDHINSVRSDNRIFNLRKCNHQQNCRHLKGATINNKLGERCITEKESKNGNAIYYVVTIYTGKDSDGKITRHEKVFNQDDYSLEDAIEYRDQKLEEFFGEFA